MPKDIGSELLRKPTYCLLKMLQDFNLPIPVNSILKILLIVVQGLCNAYIEPNVTLARLTPDLLSHSVMRILQGKKSEAIHLNVYYSKLCPVTLKRTHFFSFWNNSFPYYVTF